jgi:transcriptional regulator with XRE-family HTH domain
MTDGVIEPVYQVFGKLLRLHRKRQPELTQEKLGLLLGLSRTSITNIEHGRQRITLHQLLEFAKALKVQPEALLPNPSEGVEASWVAKKLPPGTEREIAEWAERAMGE